MFERASREKLLFKTDKGDFNVEDLWDMDLVTLDGYAVKLKKKLDDQEISFIDQPLTKDSQDQLRFDIMKHIIDTKITERDTKRQQMENAKKRQEIMELIKEKEKSNMESLSREDLIAMLEDLKS